MYLDGFLTAIGVDDLMVRQIRATLDGFADDLGNVELVEASGLGGSATGIQLASDTNLAQAQIVGAMQELAAALREFGINLDLWQGDLTYTDEEASLQIQAIREIQDTVSYDDFHNVPASTGGGA